MLPGARDRLAGSGWSVHLIRNQETVNRTVAIALVQLEGTINQGFHSRNLPDEFGVIFGKRNRRSPCRRRPIEERHLCFRGRVCGGFWILQQSFREAGVLHFETAQAISLG